MSIDALFSPGNGFVHEEVVEARIQVANSPGPHHHGVAFVGGFVPPHDPSLAPLRQCRDRIPVDAFEDQADYQFRMDGTYSYGGLIYGHFGHVMCEMVHRVTTVRRHFREKPWIFVGLRGQGPLLGFSSLPPTFKSALEFLDVAPEMVLCLHQDASVARLLVAEQGSDFGGGPKPGYLDLLSRHANQKLDRLFGSSPRSLRVFVSRSGLDPTGNLLGDRYIESLLSAEGWTIFHPERHSLAEQMECYRRSTTVVFPEGSACHGLELLGDDALNTGILIERRPSHRRVFENVLRPRCQRFIRIEGARQVGGMVTYPGTDEPYENLAIYLYDVTGFVQTLRENHIARLAGFDPNAYIAAAHDDLELYIRYQLGDQTSDALHDRVTSLREAFERSSAELLSRF